MKLEVNIKVNMSKTQKWIYDSLERHGKLKYLSTFLGRLPEGERRQCLDKRIESKWTRDKYGINKEYFRGETNFKSEFMLRTIYKLQQARLEKKNDEKRKVLELLQSIPLEKLERLIQIS